MSSVMGTYSFFSGSKKYKRSLMSAGLNPSSTNFTFFILKVPVISRQGYETHVVNFKSRFLQLTFENQQQTEEQHSRDAPQIPILKSGLGNGQISDPHLFLHPRPYKFSVSAKFTLHTCWQLTPFVTPQKSLTSC